MRSSFSDKGVKLIPACFRVPEFGNSPKAKPMAGRSILCDFVPWWLPEQLLKVFNSLKDYIEEFGNVFFLYTGEGYPYIRLTQ
jgi:hypothetical protein